jgi:2-iminobutanoate/2-iminopropanoate deaminase
LSQEEIALNRRRRSTDARRDTAIRFAKRLIETLGRVADAQLAAVRHAGFTDAQIVEMVALSVQFLLTNFMNNFADTDIHRLPRRRTGRRCPNRSSSMKRQIIRVEPLSTYLERWKAPTSAMTRHGDTLYVSGFPPFDPDTGEIVDAPIERQAELVLEQMKLCPETAGSSLENVLKCNVYCTSVDKFAAVNTIYARYFPQDPPARIFVCVPAWRGHFDIEIDCIAAV